MLSPAAAASAMTRDAARPIAALEREMREITGAAFKTYGPA
jgi:hypothetical protein